MNIYVDFDDCLCETGRYFPGLVAKLFGKNIPYEEMRYFDLQESFSLTDEQYAGMVEIGKLAFGVHYNENSVDPQAAMQAAMDAVADGLVRVFRGQEEFTGLDTPIELSQGDVLTFVRLTMLSGRLW